MPGMRYSVPEAEWPRTDARCLYCCLNGSEHRASHALRCTTLAACIAHPRIVCLANHMDCLEQHKMKASASCSRSGTAACLSRLVIIMSLNGKAVAHSCMKAVHIQISSNTLRSEVDQHAHALASTFAKFQRATWLACTHTLCHAAKLLASPVLMLQCASEQLMQRFTCKKNITHRRKQNTPAALHNAESRRP